jgi:hypothetical protein
MPRKIALKKLKASDLSFFQSYLTRFPQSKQKGFNLDRRVIETILFPSLTEAVAALPDGRAPVYLSLFGPGGTPPHSLMRKILKQEKNWRLNGEVVPSPAEQIDRYDILEAEDLAIMEFSGASVPTAVKVVLISATHPGDASLHSTLTAAYPGQSMTVLSEADIESAVANAAPADDHPIRDWLDKELLEEVGLGSSEARDILRVRRQGRGITQAELKKAKASAEAVGRLGEELLDHHYREVTGTLIHSHEWISDKNAISPYDFLVSTVDSGNQHVDAKSTAGPFASAIHMSAAEIRHATTSGVRYDICRLYNVKETGATFRVAKHIAARLAPVVVAMNAMPPGVKVDSFAFDPDFFGFDVDEQLIAYEDDDEPDAE